MDERARKRKLEELDESDIEGVEKELPKQGLKLPQEKKTKKQKVADSLAPSGKDGGLPKQNGGLQKLTEEKTLKQQRKKEKKLKNKEAKKAKASSAAEHVVVISADQDAEESPAMEEKINGAVAEEEISGGELEQFEADGLEEENPEMQASSVSPSPAPPSPSFDNATEQPSANTSTSSVILPATAPKHIKLPTDPELLRARLAARIDALRAARKADGADGVPARNRQELMEVRRKKEEQRRAHKKELRLKAKIEEDARREAALASARDSPASSMLSPLIRSPDNNFSFGRVAFADGQQMNEDLSLLRDAPKKKGPQDPATALQASENKRLRLAGLDDEKRADIEEKDLWLNAKKKAHGEKVRDDTSLLKKTLKRKEKAKKKSEKEWTERKEGVAKGQAIRQKKREENIQKRKDEKGSKGKGKGKSGGRKVGGSKGKPKSRPGFEGSFGSKSR
jgi:hypothetical protein